MPLTFNWKGTKKVEQVKEKGETKDCNYKCSVCYREGKGQEYTESGHHHRKYDIFPPSWGVSVTPHGLVFVCLSCILKDC